MEVDRAGHLQVFIIVGLGEASGNFCFMHAQLNRTEVLLRASKKWLICVWSAPYTPSISAWGVL